MGLLDLVSHLSFTTDDILTTSNRTITDVGPFTDTVLGKHQITDIIRDAEEGKQDLFTHRSVDVGGVKDTGVRECEQDVDVILSAALRLVETYGSMLRAKSHIEGLLEELKNADPESAGPDIPSLKDEERAVVKIEAQPNAARRRISTSNSQ